MAAWDTHDHRPFSRPGLAALLLAMLGVPILPACEQAPEALLLDGGPTAGVQFDAIGIRRIGWANVSQGEAVLAVDLVEPAPMRLELRLADVDDWSDALRFGAIDSSLHHEVAVTGLSASTSYVYRLSPGLDDWADTDRLGRPLSLRTAPAQQERSCIALLADSQGGAFDELLPDLNGLIDRTHAALFLGDLVAVGADPAATAEHQYLDYLLGPLSDLTSHAPLFAVLGNHDASHTNDPNAFAAAVEAFRRNLVLPGSGLTPELDYSVEWGAAKLVVLNSIDATRPKSRGVLTADQLEWTRAEFATSSKPWRIVALHHLVHGWEAPAGQEQAEWFHIDNFAEAHDAFVEAAVDLVLSGHRHAFNRVVVDGVTYVIVPPLSRDQVLFNRYGEADYENLVGEQGSVARALGTVFGYGLMCVDGSGLELEIRAYEATATDLIPIEVPLTEVRGQ